MEPDMNSYRHELIFFRTSIWSKLYKRLHDKGKMKLIPVRDFTCKQNEPI